MNISREISYLTLDNKLINNSSELITLVIQWEETKKQVKHNSEIKWSGKKKRIPEGWQLLKKLLKKKLQ